MFPAPPRPVEYYSTENFPVSNDANYSDTDGVRTSSRPRERERDAASDMSAAVCFRGYVSACGINVGITNSAKKARRVAEIRKKPAGVALKDWGVMTTLISKVTLYTRPYLQRLFIIKDRQVSAMPPSLCSLLSGWLDLRSVCVDPVAVCASKILGGPVRGRCCAPSAEYDERQ